MSDDEVAEATYSKDSERMMAALDLKGSQADRHYLFVALVDLLDRRQDSRLTLVCQRHVDEFGRMAAPLRRWDKRDCGGNGDLPNVPSFEFLARVHLRAGRFDGAEAVCRRAISLGVGWNDREERYSRLLLEIAAARERDQRGR